MTMSKNVSRLTALVWMSFAVLQALPLVASAQIEEIVVSTRRKEESLQDVPIAVSAITSEQIQQQGITNLADVVASQPSVQFDQSFGPSDNRITIRGLSNTRGRSNVAFLVDGIDVTTENLISAGSGLLANRRLLNDVERIEIVKGPQSALFGRAAFAGALSYITKDPTDEFEGRVGFDIGDYGRRTVQGAVGGPLSDTFGVRVTGVQFNEDGFYTNSISGNDVGGSDGYGAALTLLWRPVDAIRVRTRLEYSEENYDVRAVVNIQGDTPYDLPASATAIVTPIITGNPATQRQSSNATNLFNFGSYCPKFGFDPLSTPGDGSGAQFCLPGTLKNADGLSVAFSEDENTGEDFTGTNTSTFFGSLIASIDLGYGTISSYTGWTDFDGFDEYDQDYQASTASDFNGNGQVPYSRDPATGKVIAGRIDTLMGHNESNQTTSTSQFSQEFRFNSQWDGPWQFTGGVLLWQDHRQLEDRNNITFCAPYGRVNPDTLLNANGDPVITTASGAAVNVTNPITGNLAYIGNVCNGGNDTQTSWQDYRRQFSDPQFASTWDARTRDVSFYGRIDWQMTEDLTLSLEDRFINSKFTITKPGSSSCTEPAFPIGSAPAGVWKVRDRSYCDIERLVFYDPNSDDPELGSLIDLDPTTGGLTLRYQEGSTYSNYNTPKVTLAWRQSDNTNLFFSWGVGQKPGGINQLAGGGGAETPSLEDERFAPEKLEAWELGIKTNFEAAGFWNVNSSIFLQDYSEKQVGIQLVSPDGISQPRIINVNGTKVWGFEFEFLWQPQLVEGLTLGLSGTLLDATFTDWTDDTRNLVRAAVYGDCPVVYKLGDQESTDPLGIPITDTNNDNKVDFNDAQPVAFCRLNYNGNELERSPKQSYSASLALKRPFLDTPFEYLFELNGNWQDERWADPENVVKLADYARLDMLLGLTSDKWDVIAYVNNVFDDDTFLTGGAGPDFGSQVTDLGFTAGFGTTHYFASLPDPRVFGVRASYRFGGGL